MAEEKVPNTDPVKSPQPAPVQPDPVQQPVAQQPTGQMPQANQSGSNKQFLYVVGAVLLVVAGVAGYGYWNGMQIKDYALKSEKAMQDVKGWETKMNLSELNSLSSSVSSETGITKIEDDMKKAKTDIEGIKSGSDKYLSGLGGSVPGKAQNLQKNIKEYFTLYKKVADEGIYSIDVSNLGITAMSDILDVSSSFDPYSTTVDTTAIYEKMGTAFKDWADGMDKLTVPDSMETFHSDMKKALNDISDAFNSADLEQINNMKDAFKGFDDMTKTITDETTKLNDLYKKITDEIPNLKNITFSF